MRAVINAGLDLSAVAAPSGDAAAFHRTLSGYRPTPVQRLEGVASELGVAAVHVKDESARLGLPSFKILGGLMGCAARAQRSAGDPHAGCRPGRRGGRRRRDRRRW